MSLEAAVYTADARADMQYRNVPLDDTEGEVLAAPRQVQRWRTPLAGSLALVGVTALLTVATRTPVAAAPATVALAEVSSSDLAVCPGESARYGDHKCNHDQTHRVCAKLLDGDGAPLSWGPRGDFWQITGQKAFQWDDQIRANNGDSWCICMWATAEMIDVVGCDNVHLHCDSTDVGYVMSQYTDAGHDLDTAHACLKKKCGTGNQLV